MLHHVKKKLEMVVLSGGSRIWLHFISSWVVFGTFLFVSFCLLVVLAFLCVVSCKFFLLLLMAIAFCLHVLCDDSRNDSHSKWKLSRDQRSTALGGVGGGGGRISAARKVLKFISLPKFNHNGVLWLCRSVYN
jgi:hypothetical protein